MHISTTKIKTSHKKNKTTSTTKVTNGGGKGANLGGRPSRDFKEVKATQLAVKAPARGRKSQHKQNRRVTARDEKTTR